MKHLVLLAATLGVGAMTSQALAAELLRSVGVGHGPGYHAQSGCATCAQGGAIGPGAGYGGYAGCCGADYPQMCCEDVWAGYCDEPRCHFWDRLHARLTTDRQRCEAPVCCQPEYGCNQLGKLLGGSDCCTSEETCCEPTCEPCRRNKLFKLPSLGFPNRCEAECEPSCDAESAVECTPCCKHRGVFGWLKRACGGSDCACETCVDGVPSEAEAVLPPAPPADDAT